MRTAAIIGCGKRGTDKEGWAIGHAHASGYLQAMPDCRLLAVDIDADNLAAFAEKFELKPDRLFSSSDALYAAHKPDVVSICTWPGLHHAQVIEAANAGVRAVVCEKPLALDNSQIEDMLAACRQKGVHLAVAHQRRYEPVFDAARQLLKDGILGHPLCMEARVGDGWDILSWTVHWFDMADYLLDAQPRFVTAGLSHTGQRRYRHAVEDSSAIFIEYDTGAQGIFITGPDALGVAITVRGPEGHMRIGDGIELFTRRGYEKRTIAGDFIGGYKGLFTDLNKVLSGELETTRCDARFCAQATRTAYAAHEAAVTQRRVDLQETVTRYAPLEVLQHPSARQALAGRAVLFADAHHADPRTGAGGREGLRDALLAAAVGEQVDVVRADERELIEADLHGCDLLVIYHTVRQSTPGIRKVLAEYVESGRPLVVAHCGIGAYMDWSEFRRWIGRYWVWGGEPGTPSGHPHVSCTLRQTSERLPLPWKEAWLPRDEVYVRLGESAPISVLATMHADGIDDPAIWASIGQPNVIVTLPGHRIDVWQLPAMQEQLRAVCQYTVERAGNAAAFARAAEE
jgi:UDP-N-acetyl-2-amino-2-deoxyglucuronate dehydrogenase